MIDCSSLLSSQVALRLNRHLQREAQVVILSFFKKRLSSFVEYRYLYPFWSWNYLLICIFWHYRRLVPSVLYTNCRSATCIKDIGIAVLKLLSVVFRFVRCFILLCFSVSDDAGLVPFYICKALWWSSKSPVTDFHLSSFFLPSSFDHLVLFSLSRFFFSFFSSYSLQILIGFVFFSIVATFLSCFSIYALKLIEK